MINTNMIDSVNHSSLIHELVVSKYECDGDVLDLEVNKSVRDKFVTYGPDDITYERNQYGFRSKEFSEINENDFNILFMGCSFTQGTGLPANHTWASFLVDRLQGLTKRKIEAFSIAKGGAGIDSQAMYLNWLLSTGFTPDLILCLVPSIHRHYHVSGGNNGLWHTFSSIPNFVPNNNHELNARKQLNSLYREPQAAYKALTNMNFISLLAQSKGITMAHSTWCPEYDSVIKKSNELGFNLSDSYVGDIGFVDLRSLDHYTVEAKGMFKQTMGRDYLHWGPRPHYAAANRLADILIRTHHIEELIQ